MNRDDVIRAAREAGVPEYDDDDCEDGVRFEAGIDALQRFAALVAAAEREACAVLVESEWSTDSEKAYGDELASCIRARGAA